MRALPRLAASLFAATLVSGCSATLRLSDGSVVEGEIQRSDAETVWVESSTDSLRRACAQREEDAPGRPLCALAADTQVTEVAIERADIVSVTHPGGKELETGAGMLATAALLFGVTALASTEENPYVTVVALTGAVVLVVPGAFLTVGGGFAYVDSRSRYAPPETSAPPAPMRDAKGIRVGFEF